MKIYLFLWAILQSQAWSSESWYEYLSNSDKDEAETIARIVMYFLWAICPILLLLVLTTNNRGRWFTFLWNLLAYMQFVRWLPAIDFDVPPYYRAFMAELWMVIDYDEIIETDAKSIDQTRIEDLGVEDSLFIGNAEEYLGIWGLVLVIYWVTLLWCNRWANKASRNALLFRTYYLTFLDMLIYALLQVQYYDFDDTFKLISTSVGILYLIQAFLALFATVYLTFKYSEDEMPNSVGFSFLVESTGKQKPFIAYQYQTFFMIVRMTAAGSYVFLYYNPEVAFGLISLFQASFVGYILFIRPFKKLVWQIGSAVSEGMVLLSLVHICLFTSDHWDYDQRKLLSVIGIGLICLTILGNLWMFLYVVLSSKPEVPMIHKIQPSDKTGNKTNSKKNIKFFDEQPTSIIDTSGGVFSAKISPALGAVAQVDSGKIIESEENKQNVFEETQLDTEKRLSTEEESILEPEEDLPVISPDLRMKPTSQVVTQSPKNFKPRSNRLDAVQLAKHDRTHNSIQTGNFMNRDRFLLPAYIPQNKEETGSNISYTRNARQNARQTYEDFLQPSVGHFGGDEIITSEISKVRLRRTRNNP